MLLALQRGLSDHTPLLLDSGEATHIRNKAAFSFEIGWSRRGGFIEMVATEWAKEIEATLILKYDNIRFIILDNYYGVLLRMQVVFIKLKRRYSFTLLMS